MTATCSSTSWSAGSRRSASSPPPTSPRWRASKGSRPIVEFFGRELARRLAAEGRVADLLAANNVMAHVPDLNDFVGGIPIVLAPDGVATIEVPHLLRLVESNQFDTIYHEHFSYFSLLTARKVFEAHGLEVFDVEELKSHGGSLRLYAQRAGTGRQAVTSRVGELAERERGLGFDTLEAHRSFSRSGQRDQMAPARVPDRAPPRGQAHRRLRRARARATRC